MITKIQEPALLKSRTFKTPLIRRPQLFRKKLEGFTDTAKPSDIFRSEEMMKWQHFDLVATPK